MPFRFRRTIRLAPGLRLNVGKRGLSTSVGGRGAQVTFGHGQTRTTIGAPGTGVSYTAVSRRKPSGMGWGQRLLWGLAALVIAAVLHALGWF